VHALFKHKKKVLEEGGVSGLEKTTSGGKDFASFLGTDMKRSVPDPVFDGQRQ
jgi:hypothetical protein